MELALASETIYNLGGRFLKGLDAPSNIFLVVIKPIAVGPHETLHHCGLWAVEQDQECNGTNRLFKVVALLLVAWESLKEGQSAFRAALDHTRRGGTVLINKTRTVKNESTRPLRNASQHMISHDGDGDFLWADPASDHVFADDVGILAAWALHLLSQHVSNADVGDVESLRKQPALRSLA